MKSSLRILAALISLLSLAPSAQAESAPPVSAPSVLTKNPGNEDDEAHALRAAASQQYDFTQASLGDVLRFLCRDAKISFISIPDDSPEAKRTITIAISGSPFGVLETICKANGLAMIREQKIWYVRPINDAEPLGRSYSIEKETVKHDVLVADIRSILADSSPESGADDKKGAEGQDPSPNKSRVIWRADAKQLYVVGTRLQHQWVQGYLTGAGLYPR